MSNMLAEYMYHSGDDLAVVNAARVSFANISTQLTNKDVSLIEYLARGIPSNEWRKIISQMSETTDIVWIEDKVNQLIDMATHWVPFSHNSITLRMKAPVPIRTQCFKHKIGFVESEESRRYISSRPEIFIPDHFRSKAKNVKQGSSGNHNLSEYWKEIYIQKTKECIDIYEKMICDEDVIGMDDETVIDTIYGISPEQARFILPQGVMVNWVWTGSLASFARYFNQRIDSHAQKESQDLAKQVSDIISPLFPISWEALTKSSRKI